MHTCRRLALIAAAAAGLLALAGPTLGADPLTGSGRCNTGGTGLLERYVYDFAGTPGGVVEVAGEDTYIEPLAQSLDSGGATRFAVPNDELWARYQGDTGAGIHVLPDPVCPPGTATDEPEPVVASDPTPALAGLLLIGLLAFLLFLPNWKRS